MRSATSQTVVKLRLFGCYALPGYFVSCGGCNADVNCLLHCAFGVMAYELFLFDLDDTLLDFRASERLSFFAAMQSIGTVQVSEELFAAYQAQNNTLWRLFEQGKVTKEYLRVERFRKTFAAHGIEIDPEVMSQRYLEALPQSVVLVEHAEAMCEWLSGRGEIGIITNGIESTQMRRIENSPLAPYISFVSVSEACGYAKPDIRFFEHSVTMAKSFAKESAIVIGDRMEADILGAHHFGVHSCWFNPHQVSHDMDIAATYEIGHLSDLRRILAA